ncbi:MAG: sulfite exporter TauE/SafE family protein [Deltaproteobacteria bacterium]|nr:sulfite exporter TauE/SafE family protein [Deltaproteobacteria bacterium]
MLFLTTLLVGLGAGGFGGLVGLGGGVVMIPLMMRFAALHQHQAHGTSLMALVFTGAAGAATYYLEGSVDAAAAACLAATAMLTAPLGALFANRLSEKRLKGCFGVFIIVVAWILLAKPYFALFATPTAGWSRVLILLASGLGAGFLSGMMGVGGGSIMVPAMVLLAGFGQHGAQGTSLLAMVPAGAVGAVTHARLGNVVTPLLPGLIPGIIVGTCLGGILAHLLSEGALRIIFAVILTWQGIRDVRRAAAMEQ